MALFEMFRSAHIVAGVAVLVTFWGAALARKGSDRHRRFGRAYLVAMAVLLSATLIMAVGMATGGQGMRAIFNVYVSLISVTSVWIAWRSIEDKDDVDAYRGPTLNILCFALGGYGLFLLAMVPKMGEPARMTMVFAFAVLGLATAGSLAWRLVRGADHSRWWLSDHLTGMALNFGATHASFSILGLSGVIPAVREPWIRTSILMCWMLSALLVRLWAGRRFLQPHGPGRIETALDRSGSLRGLERTG
jgi:hypothetical protein